MSTRPAISCVLIFLDGERFIDAAIASVVAQDDPSWELILVDDGSTDSSSRIAQRWVRSDPRIRLVEHPGHVNRGMSASRNLGIALATGDLVGFLDCDDVWLPASVGHVRRLAVAHPDADVIITRCWRWSTWDGSALDVLMDQPVGVAMRTTLQPPELLTAIYVPAGWTFVPAMCSVAVRRDALIDLGGMEAAFGGLYEDQVLYTKLAVRLTAVVDDRPLALYRQHPTSATAVAAGAGEWNRPTPSADYLRFESWQREYVETTLGTDHPAVAALAEHAGGRRRWVAAAAARDDPPSAWRGWWRTLVARGRRLAGRARRGLRHRRSGSPDPTITERWSAQHLGALGAARRGRVLVVIDGADPAMWSSDLAAVAAPSATEVVVGRLGDHDEDGTFDHVIVALDAATGRAIELLAGVCRAVPPSGTLSAMFPGPAWCAEAASMDELIAVAQLGLPGHDVVGDSFGNATTARLVRDGRPASDAVGVSIDRHEPDVPVVLALSALPRPA
ncbi:MAG: glycosyltransferase family A protein [Ilumatobacteraceae bacterium]